MLVIGFPSWCAGLSLGFRNAPKFIVTGVADISLPIHPVRTKLPVFSAY
jgi:hypothetical protein